MTVQQETGGEQELLRLEAGPYTDELKNFIFGELPVDAVPHIDWRPERSYAPGLAQEPVTFAVTFVMNFPEIASGATVGTAAIVAFAGIIKHWMNLNAARLREDETIKVVVKHPELQEPMFKELGEFEKVLLENEDKPPPPKE